MGGIFYQIGIYYLAYFHAYTNNNSIIFELITKDSDRIKKPTISVEAEQLQCNEDMAS